MASSTEQRQPLLLDTQLLLWRAVEPERLSAVVAVIWQTRCSR
ncbi:hypothetical protein [Synechococcus sp. CCY 0621]|nr:hypothetical protein [Synechococcus sp. CCY 0621]